VGRRHLILDLADPAEPRDRLPLTVRHPSRRDVEAIADLMLDAYAGTIDADGSETLQDARAEVIGYFDAASGSPMLEHSFLAFDGDRLVSAVLVSRFEDVPLVAYAMTRSTDKGRGLAGGLTGLALEALRRTGDRQVHLWVTAGNADAEHLYERLGFRDADPPLRAPT
jgi:GNAT superfamily N-acetyltransferase